MSNYLALQTELKNRGLNPGPLDGIWGPKTRRAMQSFQIENKLTVTPLPDAATLAALFTPGAAPVPSSKLPITWLDEANRLRGVHETPGSKSNPVLLDWADDLDLHYPSDDIPWCGLFVAHTMRVALPDEPLPGNPLGARAYERFGIGCEPQLGALAVFWRKSKTSGLGHVGYLVGQRPDAYQVLGGNQGDAVSTAWVSKSRLVDTRWPVTGDFPLNRTLPLYSASGAHLSTNEA